MLLQALKPIENGSKKTAKGGRSWVKDGHRWVTDRSKAAVGRSPATVSGESKATAAPFQGRRLRGEFSRLSRLFRASFGAQSPDIVHPLTKVGDIILDVPTKREYVDFVGELANGTY
jgi:hypothetical protein